MKYKLFIVGCLPKYCGYSLVAAENKEEAEKVIKTFKSGDPSNA